MSKKLILTGAGCLIGSHLTERLVESGHRVRAFVRYNSRNNWGWLEDSQFKGEIEVFCGDIRDYDSVYDAMKGCDTVFHLAALIGIPYSYVSPLAYIRTNIEGTYNVLQAAKNLNIENLLTTSTSEVYGGAHYIPIDENHPINPQSPYAASKAAADHIALSFHKSFSLPVKIVRPFNTFGPRQSARGVIPTTITQALTKDKILLGSLTPTRDFTYVLDVISGYIKIAQSEEAVGEVVNIGSGVEISIGDLARKILVLTGKETEIIPDTERVRPDSSEVERLCADAKKAKEIMGWEVEVALDKGLELTIDWVSKHLDVYKADIYNI